MKYNYLSSHWLKVRNIIRNVWLCQECASSCVEKLRTRQTVYGTLLLALPDCLKAVHKGNILGTTKNGHVVFSRSVHAWLSLAVIMNGKINSVDMYRFFFDAETYVIKKLIFWKIIKNHSSLND